MNGLIDMTPPEPNKELRPDFDFDCECGFFVCDTCGYPLYPMELESDEQGYDHCPECEDGDMVEYKNHI